ncbi:MAG: DUF983 domain-containing protein [Pirellulales bacterium]
MRLRKIFFRSLSLRCPLCGQGKLFSGWFRTHEKCPNCNAIFAREPGFFIGSIYFNYGLTTLIVAILFPIALFGYSVPNNSLLYWALAFVVLFPILFFHTARSLWLGFDQFVDPRQEQDEE